MDYYPTNSSTANPTVIPLALGTCACACFSPSLLVLIVAPNQPPSTQTKKNPLPLFLCAPHKYYSHARLTSILLLSPPSPLSFPSLSLSTRAPILTLGVRDKLQKGLFFFIFSPLLLEILLGFSSQ